MNIGDLKKQLWASAGRTTDCDATTTDAARAEQCATARASARMCLSARTDAIQICAIEYVIILVKVKRGKRK